MIPREEICLLALFLKLLRPVWLVSLNNDVRVFYHCQVTTLHSQSELPGYPCIGWFQFSHT